METSSRSRIALPGRRGPPWIFLAAAALCLALLGLWLVAAEREGVRAALAERLRARASAASALVQSQAARCTREAALGEGVLVAPDGRFLEPPEPRAIERLELATGGDDPGAWLLALAESTEVGADDPQEVLRLYGAASSAARAPACRALARARTAAFHRRRGEEEEARQASAAFLAELDPSLARTREALVARALAPRPDGALQGDLLLALGTADEPVALGLLRTAGLDDGSALAARRAELERQAALRPLLPGPAAPDEGVALASGRLLAWVRREDGALRLAEAAVPELGPDAVLLHPGDEPAADAELVQYAPLGAVLPGTSVAALLPRAEARRAERARLAWLAAGLGTLVAGGGAALFATWRAVRREQRAAAEQAAFVARVGHDLRTPLSVIRLYSESLAEERVGDPAEAREFARVAARESARLSELVDAVLDLARVASPHGLRRRPVDLVRLAREVGETHRPLLAEAGLALEIALPDEPLVVLGDEDALRGALGNALENCLHHAASGGYAALRVEREGSAARLRVSDRGPGLPAELGERVFERFVRGSTASARGAGLGLALVREVAEAHGGSARARDAAGGGLELCVTVPLAAEARR